MYLIIEKIVYSFNNVLNFLDEQIKCSEFVKKTRKCYIYLKKIALNIFVNGYGNDKLERRICSDLEKRA